MSYSESLIDPVLLRLDTLQADDGDDVIDNTVEDELEDAAAERAGPEDFGAAEEEGADGPVAGPSSRIRLHGAGPKSTKAAELAPSSSRGGKKGEITKRRPKKKETGSHARPGGEHAARDDEEDPMIARLAGFVSSSENAPSGPGAGFLAATAASKLPDDDKITRRPRKKKVHKPSHEVNVQLSNANFAYIRGDMAQAINDFREVIRLDPRIASAWKSLATCYTEQGEVDMAREMRFCGLHVEGDADEWKEMAFEFKTEGLQDQAIYCFRQALAQDPEDVIVLWEMADHFMRAQNAARAVDCFRRILRLDPASAHDFTLLMDFYPLFMTSPSQQRRGVEMLRTAFDWHVETFPGPRAPDADADDDDDDNDSGGENNTMQLEHVIALVDVLRKLVELEDAIETIKRGQRWLQGRSKQRFWDGMDDDREYDPPEAANKRKNRTPAEADFGPYPLEMNLRHRLALCRLQLGDDGEAEIHVEQMLTVDVGQNRALIAELGAELYERKTWSLALRCLSALESATPDVSDADNVFKMGVCHYELGDLGNAEHALRWVISEEPTHNNARLRLANVLEDSGRRNEAFDLVSEVLKYKSLHEPAEKRGRGPNRERSTMDGLSKAIMEDQMRQKMAQMWQEVREAEEGIDAGHLGAIERYTQVAGTMVESFRLAKSNFQKGRGVQRIAVFPARGAKKDGAGNEGGERGDDIASAARTLQDRLERTMGFEDDEPEPDTERVEEFNPMYITKRKTSFYGVDAEEWLGLIIKYCCVLMARNENQNAMDILEHTIWAGLFYNSRCEVAFRMTMIACAMRMRSWQRVADNCRRLAQMHQFRLEPFLIMLACLGGGGARAAASFQETTLQKFILRELRLYEAAAGGKRFHYSVPHGRWAEERQLGLTERLGDEVVWEGEEGAWRKGARFRIGEGEGEGEEDGREEEDEDEPRGEGAKDVEDVEMDAAEEAGEEGRDGGRERSVGSKTLDGIPPKPTQYSPAWNTTYAQLMLTARSHHTALFYLMRAYEQNPYDPYICLLIAQAYLSRSMNRQNDNRNQFVAQGIAFLARYRKLSPQDAVAQEEVDYNFGRAFHHVGIPHLAVKHYERVLGSVEVRMRDAEEVAAAGAVAGAAGAQEGRGGMEINRDEGEEMGTEAEADKETPESIRTSSLAYEAAHNLMLLYAASGSAELIRERSRWLAI